VADNELIASVVAGDIARAESALRGGAAVDEQDEHGYSALCWAAAKGSLEATDKLLEYDADVFHTTKDGRTPYLIAIAAGRSAVARRLKDAEEARGGDPEHRSSRLGELRPYCSAYQLKQLRAFPQWHEEKANGGQVSGAFESLSDDTVVFLHQDFTVSRSVWQGEQIVFDAITPEWRSFCEHTLGFHVPSDFELILRSVN
jgi:hypothetical protein